MSIFTLQGSHLFGHVINFIDKDLKTFCSLGLTCKDVNHLYNKVINWYLSLPIYIEHNYDHRRWFMFEKSKVVDGRNEWPCFISSNGHTLECYWLDENFGFVVTRRDILKKKMLIS